jgi:hypothetical protein
MNSRTLLLPMLALGIGVYFWFTAPPASPVLAAGWRIGSGGELRHGRHDDEVAADSPLRLWIRSDEPRHLYVFSHSHEDGTLLLFPSPDVASDCRNPLPAGQVVLPGKLDGKELAWTTRAGVLSPQTFLAIASEQPVPELEALLPRLRRWSNQALPDRSMVVTLPAAGADFAGKPRQPLPDPLLLAAAALGADARSGADPNGPMVGAPDRTGIWFSAFRIRELRQADAKGK